MKAGLHSRKKNSNPDDGFDPEALKSNRSGDDDEVKTHGRVNFLRRFVTSEVGCAIEVIVGFLIFGLLFGYVVSHHQQRKVSISLFRIIPTLWIRHHFLFMLCFNRCKDQSMTRLRQLISLIPSTKQLFRHV